MRRGLCVFALLLAAFWAGSARGEAVVLKDGQVLELAKPYVKKGQMAILTLKDGSVRSVKAAEIDLEKTAALKAAPAPEAAPVATPTKPMSLAEAAQAKGTKRASVSLTDQDVARGMTAEGEAGDRARSAGDVDIGSASSSKTKTGYSFTGTVVNRSKVEVQGVSVTIEVIGNENKTLTTVFGTVAKTNLGPGESSGFQGEVSIEAEPKTFRYVPTWSVVVPAGQPAPEGAKPASAPQGGKAGEAAEPTPTPPPRTPPPAPTPRPRADFAAPMANAPVGEPSAPGQPYLPIRPTEGPK